MTAENGAEEEIECWQNPYTEEYYVFLPSYGEEQGYRLCLNKGDCLELDGEELSQDIRLTGEELRPGEEYSFCLRDSENRVTASGSLSVQKSAETFDNKGVRVYNIVDILKVGQCRIPPFSGMSAGIIETE